MSKLSSMAWTSGSSTWSLLEERVLLGVGLRDWKPVLQGILTLLRSESRCSRPSVPPAALGETEGEWQVDKRETDPSCAVSFISDSPPASLMSG